MKSRFQKYHCYKSSGIEWLGDIPSHWRTEKIKYMVSSCSGGTPNTDNSDYWDGDIPWVSAKDMKRSRISTTEDTITDLGLKESASRLIPENTVLMVVRSGILKHTIPVAINTVPVAINQDMKALFVKEGLESEFLHYFAEGMQKTLLPLWAKQGCTVESIDQGFMGNTYLPLPPVPEQKAIAAFLDRETAQIDGLIGKREKLIALLQEKRAALISHAVTKGLNPSAKMKPSGIDWLGDIPAHWETEKIKYNTHPCSGGTPNTENPEYWNGDIPWVSPKDMKAPRISAAEDSITELGLKESASRLIDENTVLIVVRSGILKHTIPVAINIVPVSINQDMKALFTKGKVTSDYLFYFINGVQENLLPLWRKQGCTVESIEQEFMGNTCLPIPPVSEQKAIAAFLDSETQRIDGLMEKERRIIEKMKEYRSALISAAVTGKIDVSTKQTETSVSSGAFRG